MLSPLYFSRNELVLEGRDAIAYPGHFSEHCPLQSWAQRYRHPDPIVVEGDPELSDLNVSQIRAIAAMIGERISLIQGPPGTGKTRTIVETVRLRGHEDDTHLSRDRH